MLLSSGRREPARSLIRLLSRPAVQGTLPAVLGPSFELMTREFVAWTGDRGFIEKYVAGWASDGREAIGERSGDGREAIGDDALAVIESVVRGTWGIVPVAVEEQLAIMLRLSHDVGEMALTGVRVGRTTLTLRYRRRPGQVVVRCEVTRGPALRVTAALGGSAWTMQVSVDEVELGGGRAVFRASGSHEVVFGTKV